MSTKERRLVSLVHFGNQLNAINWPLVAISGLFLCMRIGLKLRQRRPLWWDDYVLTLSWLALLLYAILYVLVLNLGFGRDPSEIPAENETQILLLVSTLSSLLILANLWSKTSFGLTLLRLPLGPLRTSIVIVLITLGTLSIGTSAFLVWVQCLVADPPWGPYSGSHCLQPNILIGYSVFMGYFSALIDLSFVVLPWKMLWESQMKKKEKVGVTLAMGMGTLAAVAAVAKSTVFPKVYTGDATAGLEVSAWGTIETGVSIMAASIPILRALVRQGQGGVPMGYATGMAATGRSEGGSVFFQRTWLKPSPSGSTTARVEPVEGPADEVLVGKVKEENVRRDRASVEMDSYEGEVRPRDFTV